MGGPRSAGWRGFVEGFLDQSRSGRRWGTAPVWRGRRRRTSPEKTSVGSAGAGDHRQRWQEGRSRVADHLGKTPAGVGGSSTGSPSATLGGRRG
ncbi:3-isopropylmalate dehydratase small subunit 2 isoform X1 [Iris pallida]|uniref:3-isopropylmalate dehydratase small subunit 2 isoform X1 n=1 Tax=Iris pallida TaxID=29817 RepID=A0AAX6EQ22_IRIPA|nr:3-isopropylmalate dehydratase small subunit 2 isoform X1 [Iris pallida]